MMLEIFVADRLLTNESANILLCRYLPKLWILLELRFSVALNMVTNKLQIISKYLQRPGCFLLKLRFSVTLNMVTKNA